MRDISKCEQRWFAGAHGNIGGGYANDVLAQIPFRWLMRKASSLGLSFKDEAELDGKLANSIVRDSFRDFAWGAYWLVSNRTYREIDGPPLVDKRGTHLHVNETIDSSVFEFARVGTYRSCPIKEWARRKGVDPKAIKNSVRADNPSTEVDD